MEIGSKEWKERRRATIGSSDAPSIMRVSPYKSAYQLWEEKVFGKEQVLNQSMKRGNDLEPVAKKWFENKIGINVSPESITHPCYSWMTATLDGYNKEKRVLVEIKCPNRDDHRLATSGKVPDKYYPQLQHQLEVTDLDNMYYLSFDGEEGVIVEVGRDDNYINNLIEEERKFQYGVIHLEPPALSDLDWIDMENDENWKDLAPRFKEVDYLINELEEERNFLRAQFVLFSEGRNARGHGIKLTKSMTKGNVEYSKIPQLEDVDLEKYRKPSYVKWRTTILN